MKLDPGMHLGMHLVSFGKSGVTLPFQEGTPLTPNAEGYSPTEVATTNSGLCTPDREIFVATTEAETSEARPDRYLDDISDDEESANAPPNKTTKAKNS
jgi:hypothetical protein